MRTILDVLRLRFDAGLSERNTARSLGVPRTTVQDYLARFRGSGLVIRKVAYFFFALGMVA